MGDEKLPMNDVDDIGRMVKGIFQDKTLINTNQYVVSESLTGTEIAEAYTRVLGLEVIYTAVDDETYQKLEFPKAHEIANMFQFFRCSDDFKTNRSEEKCSQVI